MKFRPNVDLAASFERMKTRSEELEKEKNASTDPDKYIQYAGALKGLIQFHIELCTEPETKGKDDLKDLDVFSSPGNSQTETEILGEMELRRTPDNMHPSFKDDIFKTLGNALKPTPNELAEYSEDVLPRKEYPRNTNNDLQDDAGNGNFQF